MTRKFSDISLDWKVWLIDLIDLKKQKFNSRLAWNQQSLGEQFSNSFTFLPLNRLSKLDTVIKQIFFLIRENPNVEIDEIIDSLFQDIGQKYSSLYLVIENFNESGPWVNEIMNSREWQMFVEQLLRQLHEFDRQNNNSWKFEKLSDLETRTYTLLSLIKSAIIESRWIPKKFETPEWFDEAKKIADSLIENKWLIESGIQSSKSIQTFNVNNIDEALRNVWAMFYYKDMYSVFQKWEVSLFDKVIEATFLLIEDLQKSPVWWFIFGSISLVLVFVVLIIDFVAITTNPTNYKDIWQIIISMHLIWASFLGYFTVFCFWNYKKIESRHESYKFRWILTRSFGYLIKTADEEQKRILYPKALDAIFKDLPESNIGHDVNINLPVTEIMKWITSKL